MGQRVRLSTREGEPVSFDIGLNWWARLVVLFTGRIHVRFIPFDKTTIGVKGVPSSEVTITHLRYED